jgi:hypothetical protein
VKSLPFLCFLPLIEKSFKIPFFWTSATTSCGAQIFYYAFPIV